jgi:hypothetical protein
MRKEHLANNRALRQNRTKRNAQTDHRSDLRARRYHCRAAPQHLRGRWVIKRELPTSTISCWDDKEAKQLIGTTIEYRTNSFRWKDKVVNHPAINVRVLTAKQFHDENSGSGANSSQVTFQQLGIRAPYVRQVELAHEAADITGATTETPGDRVLMKGRNTIVFSVCNVYFEAQRAPLSTSAKKSRSVPRT